MHPKKFKYKQIQKLNFFKRNKLKYYKLNHGNYALKAKDFGKLNIKQLETIKLLLKRQIKKLGKVWLRVEANRRISKKPIQSRMGKGKGKFDQWLAYIKPGMLVFEMQLYAEKSFAIELLNMIKSKLSFKTKIIKRNEYDADNCIFDN